jgi:peptide chain release factor 1
MTEQKDSLLAKLDQIEARYGEIEKQISEPEVASNPARLIALSKEQGKFKTIVTKYRRYQKAETGIEEAEQILADSSADEDFKTLAKEEIQQLEEQKNSLLEEITNSIVMADDMDIDSVIIEIRAGTGGEEAALFARDLYGMYIKYAEARRWKIEQLDFRATEKNGFREVIFGIKGPGVWSELGYEGGGHRVQRSRSGGPGGQSVNKLNSAIKLEHIPTGITVSMQDEKSQHKNRSKAWRVLRSRIYEHHMSKKRAERDSQRKSMIGSGDRSQKIRTYNFPQNRVTDHRINLSLYSLDKVLAGDMSEIIAALKDHDRQQRLKNL